MDVKIDTTDMVQVSIVNTSTLYKLAGSLFLVGGIVDAKISQQTLHKIILHTKIALKNFWKNMPK